MNVQRHITRAKKTLIIKHISNSLHPTSPLSSSVAHLLRRSGTNLSRNTLGVIGVSHSNRKDLMSLIDRIADVCDLEERWPLILLLFATAGLVVALVFTTSLYALEFTFAAFILLSFIVVLSAVVLDLAIGVWLGTLIVDRIRSDIIRSILKVLSITGALYGLYGIYSAVVHIQWESWGINEFLSSMPQGIDIHSWSNKSILDSDVLPKLIKVWKALLHNVGRVILFFIYNMLAPWSWISTTIGILKGGY